MIKRCNYDAAADTRHVPKGRCMNGRWRLTLGVMKKLTFLDSWLDDPACLNVYVLFLFG